MIRLLPIVALAASCLSTLALAQDVLAIAVHHTDLDLARPRDVARLDARIARAAAAACGTPSAADLVGSNALPQCTRDAIASVHAQRERAIVAARGGVAAKAFSSGN